MPKTILAGLCAAALALGGAAQAQRSIAEAARARQAASPDAPEAPTEYVIYDNLGLYADDTPFLRLHQNQGTFPQYDWYVRGNETRWYVRDAGPPVTTPLVVYSGAPNDSFVLTAPRGDIGMGTVSPAASLHLLRADGTVRLRVEEASATTAERVLLHLRNKGKTRFLIENTQFGDLWTFDNNGPPGFSISKVGTGVNELLLSPTGDLTIQGVLTQLSDRNVKRDVERVDGAAVLERLAALPVSTWSYTADTAGARHMGPMAQDFAAAFGLGTDDTHVAPSDVAGVGLAAVQALKRLLDENAAEQRSRLAEKDAQIRELSERLAALEARAQAAKR